MLKICIFNPPPSNPIAIKTKLATTFNSSDYKKNSNLPWSTSSTTTTAIDIIQINLAKSKVATAHLEKLASEININHFLVQEPYVKEGKISGVPRKWHQWLSSNNNAEIISLPSTNSPIFICSTTNLTAIKIQTITGPVNLISAYSSPYAELQDTAQDLANLLTKIGPEQALIGVHMNAPNTLWDYANNSPRGNIMEDLISGLNLHLLNEKNSEPTFQRRNANGWPDLTLVKGVQMSHSNTLETLIHFTRYSNMESAIRLPRRLLHKTCFLEPGGRRSAPARQAPRSAPAGICR
ncbi:hypothetical protein AVEN_117588-1 [Araneus ventricosus]|uniref:Endonuclease/exonuclease/phosphatase domain-containing protein n=1 Tax=Araneus ventricosus TaxID=182803 RepID=A0A4Y2ULV4_ARAVE|nr:hypothetical protein AVEN_117588-1 [Araneus ventricosus]